jgi:hypothetical protein
MFTIKYYSQYVTDGSTVFGEKTLYPLTPRAHPSKGYKQFFMKGDSGNSRFVGVDELKSYIQKQTETSAKSRGKTVLHRSSGKTFSSMKSACEAFGIKLVELKSSSDFVITSAK